MSTIRQCGPQEPEAPPHPRNSLWSRLSLISCAWASDSTGCLSFLNLTLFSPMGRIFSFKFYCNLSCNIIWHSGPDCLFLERNNGDKSFNVQPIKSRYKLGANLREIGKHIG
ncbi:hypothetical protein J6590_058821 [Homalodisca vitripennis]|nr:hypothetical protein J6590_058821 [Homalodisca vitripennis]